VIIDTARAVDADLIALGSRGRGRLGALILGSVSAEVVSHAPMSVLVARSRGPFRRVVLADDGSPAAARAREIVGTWAVFTHAAITVACVAYAVPVLVSVLPSASTPLLGAHPAGTIAEARRRRDRILDEAGRALEARGHHVQLVGAEGDPAARILDVAADVGADLIVSGSRGLSGVDQVLMGSVARNLLHAATCSILIARS